MTPLRAMRIMTRYAPHNDTLGGKFQHFAASFRQAEKLGPVKTIQWQHRTQGSREGGSYMQKVHGFSDFQHNIRRSKISADPSTGVSAYDK